MVEQRVTMVVATRRKIMTLFMALNVIGCIAIVVMVQKAALVWVDREEQAVSPTQIVHSLQSTDSNYYWSLSVSDKGQNVSCKISTSTTIKKTTPQTNYSARDIVDKKIIIHIHGLHHSGTGYLRKTLLDALNYELAPSSHYSMEYNGTSQQFSSASAAACMHDSLLPYRDLYNNKTKLKEDHHKAEEEGQHLQNLYPTFYQRTQPFTIANSTMRHTAKVAYLADLCLSDDNAENKQIGNMLFQQWSNYWNVASSTKFLLQKTPTLDVQFLESTKILPTLHVILVRHPMTSNSWEIPNMSHGWAIAYHHVLELLIEGKVEWYAVLTFEALLEYREVVLEELMEVVRSGMKRFGLASMLTEQQLNNKNNSNKESRFRRQLHLRNVGGVNDRKRRANIWSELPSNSYLIPKMKSVELWRKCLQHDQCRKQFTHLSNDILPLFGYVSVKKSDASLVKRINDGSVMSNVPLTIYPAPVTVSKKYGRVLFSSEDNALKLLRQINNNSVETQAEGLKQTELILKIVALLKKIAA